MIQQQGKIIRLQPKKPPRQKIGVIVQARMTSIRFPGKSMALLAGKPVIEHVLERARNIRANKQYDIETIVAVPDTDESEPIIAHADKMGISNFCGDEHDVLRRYYDCALFFGFDYIVRITGDCPFIDPKVSSEVLQLLLWRKLDYSSNIFPKRTYPKGLDTEAFTLDCLEAAYKMGDAPYFKEHVTPWMQSTIGLKRAVVQQKDNMAHLNYCVDYPEDIPRLEKILKDQTPQLDPMPTWKGDK